MRSGFHNRTFKESLRWAWEGVRHATVTQRNLRRQLLVAALVLGVGMLASLSGVQMAILSLAVLLVLCLELVNTAFETALDALAPGEHGLIGRAKDVAAGAVLLAAVGSVGVGAAVLMDRWDQTPWEPVLRAVLACLMGFYLVLALMRRPPS